MSGKQVLINASTVLMINHILEEFKGLVTEPHYVDCIEAVLSETNAKMDAFMKRDAYSKFKDKSLSSEEREKARKLYLELVGMNEEWRY